jgi:23S rRNA pseudouridine1911/1915/1917 synthase
LGLIHRLDRPASVICLLAKTKGALAALNKQMQARSVEKTYWAVVPKGDLPTEGHLVHYLRRNGRTKKAEVAKKEKNGFKKAELTYRIIDTIDRYQLLEIQLLTGRFHQIRAQLAAIGFPIKGDVKYGAKRPNADRSIHLHARSIAFTHPTSKERVHLVAPPPEEVIWEAFSIVQP